LIKTYLVSCPLRNSIVGAALIWTGGNYRLMDHSYLLASARATITVAARVGQLNAPRRLIANPIRRSRIFQADTNADNECYSSKNGSVHVHVHNLALLVWGTCLLGWATLHPNPTKTPMFGDVTREALDAPFNFVRPLGLRDPDSAIECLRESLLVM